MHPGPAACLGGGRCGLPHPVAARARRPISVPQKVQKKGMFDRSDAPEPAPDLTQHRAPADLADRIALRVVKTMRLFADAFFARRYGHRAVVLETVAAVPGMVGGLLQHLRALRRIRDDQGWIRDLLDEAENERMHLMAFVEIARPTILERGLILVAQGVFFNLYFLLYLLTPRVAHRVVGYLEEEAVISHTH